MDDKLRRRVRARILEIASTSLGRLPAPVVRAPLLALAPLARLTRYERVVSDNLALALGELDERARARIARGVWRHSARLFAEWIALAGRGGRGAWIDRAVELDDSLAIVERELARGRGALIVTAHIGNWELLCTRLVRHGFQGAVVGRERADDPSHSWLARAREKHGVATLPQSAPAREVLRVLRRGEVIGLLADLESRQIAGEFVPFFGRTALTMTAPASLARAAGLPLCPVACVRVGDRYRMFAEEPLALDTRLARREATTALTLRLNQVFERWIRTWPEQWAWHQPRWRTQPGDAAPVSKYIAAQARVSLQSADEDLASGSPDGSTTAGHETIPHPGGGR